MHVLWAIFLVANEVNLHYSKWLLYKWEWLAIYVTQKSVNCLGIDCKLNKQFYRCLEIFKQHTGFTWICMYSRAVEATALPATCNMWWTPLGPRPIPWRGTAPPTLPPRWPPAINSSKILTVMKSIRVFTSEMRKFYITHCFSP